MSKPEMFASKIESVHKRTSEYDSPWIHCHDCGATWARGKASPVVCTMTESAMLELRDRQLADCTRAMREVATALLELSDDGCDDCSTPYQVHTMLAQKLNEARAGKGKA